MQLQMGQPSEELEKIRQENAALVYNERKLKAAVGLLKQALVAKTDYLKEYQEKFTELAHKALRLKTAFDILKQDVASKNSRLMEYDAKLSASLRNEQRLKATIERLQQELASRNGPADRERPARERHSVWVEQHEVRSFQGQIITTIDFCRIPPGTFQMGTPDRRRQVTLTQPFLLAKYPVTRSLWRVIMGANPGRFDGENCPVEMVSWNDVQQFIGKLNEVIGSGRYRLPTEAEWEYACRAGAQKAYGFEDDERLLGRYAWYEKNSSCTQSVGETQPNDWGLYDMRGNVWEWCQDWYGEYSTHPVTDPAGPFLGACRVVRGGAWNCAASYCRSDSRSRFPPGFRDNCIGFRLAAFPVHSKGQGSGRGSAG